MIFLSCDLISKFVVWKFLPLYKSVKILGNLIRITHIENPGMVFGLPIPQKSIFLVLSFAVVLFLIFLSVKKGGIVIPMITAGAIGNFVDRLWKGTVTDFIDIGVKSWRYPTFNLADSFITVGLIILILKSLKGGGHG